MSPRVSERRVASRASGAVTPFARGGTTEGVIGACLISGRSGP